MTPPLPSAAGRPSRLIAGLLLLPLLQGCGGADETPPPQEADPVTAELMAAAQDRGFGLGQQVPTDPGQEVSIDDLGYDEGPREAPVRVLEFSDFGCGYCRQFHQEAYPVLAEEYMGSGKVLWKYVPMILGQFPNAVEAARTGECAGEQGRFPEMRDLLFDRQQAWKNAGDPEALLAGYARDMGLDMARYESCVAEGRRDARLQAGTQLFRELGGRGTPTFFVVGYAPIPGAIPLELFQQALDTAYARAMSGNGPGE